MKIEEFLHHEASLPQLCCVAEIVELIDGRYAAKESDSDEKRESDRRDDNRQVDAREPVVLIVIFWHLFDNGLCCHDTERTKMSVSVDLHDHAYRTI